MGLDHLAYLYRWDRQGRKGQPCYVLARGKMNSCLVEFADGYRMVTSRNAIKRLHVSEQLNTCQRPEASDGK